MKPLILILTLFALASCSKEEIQPEPQKLTYRITAGVASEVVIYLHRTNMVVRDTIYGQVIYYDEARPGDILRVQLQSLASPQVSINIEYGGTHFLHKQGGPDGFIQIEGRLPQ